MGNFPEANGLSMHRYQRDMVEGPWNILLGEEDVESWDGGRGGLVALQISDANHHCDTEIRFFFTDSSGRKNPDLYKVQGEIQVP